MDNVDSLHSNAPVLAFTYSLDGRVLPYAEVDCGRVRSLIRPALAFESFVRRQYLLGRALGRVLAHEMYHIFARTPDHGNYGVAKRYFTGQNLVGQGLEFDEPDWLMLSHQLNQPPAQTPNTAADPEESGPADWP